MEMKNVIRPAIRPISAVIFAIMALGTTGCTARTILSLYLTYWEGTCNSGFASFGRGCSLGDSKIRRCTVTADNALACIDEAEATKAIAREK